MIYNSPSVCRLSGKKIISLLLTNNKCNDHENLKIPGIIHLYFQHEVLYAQVNLTLLSLHKHTTPKIIYQSKLYSLHLNTSENAKKAKFAAFVSCCWSPPLMLINNHNHCQYYCHQCNYFCYFCHCPFFVMPSFDCIKTSKQPTMATTLIGSTNMPEVYGKDKSSVWGNKTFFLEFRISILTIFY